MNYCSHCGQAIGLYDTHRCLGKIQADQSSQAIQQLVEKTNDQKPPREFTLHYDDAGFERITLHGFDNPTQDVHVIEYSAYESLKTKVEISDERANGFYRRAWNAEKENAELRKSITAWAEKWTTQNDQSGTHRLWQEKEMRILKLEQEVADLEDIEKQLWSAQGGVDHWKRKHKELEQEVERLGQLQDNNDFLRSSNIALQREAERAGNKDKLILDQEAEIARLCKIAENYRSKLAKLIRQLDFESLDIFQQETEETIKEARETLNDAKTD